MLRRLFSMLLAYLSGLSAGKAAVHLEELKIDDKVARAVAQAEAAAPRDVAGVADELRRGSF